MAERINAFERLRRIEEDNIKKGFMDTGWKTVLYMYLDNDKEQYQTFFILKPTRCPNFINLF